ncbi:MAG: sigma-70 family RNA polymerase sigma factor [bacterium]|nr:sigma-70 family RNA polymerase sigma factor [bacterium]
MSDQDAEFRAFVGEAEPRLRRAYIGVVGVDGVPDAVAEALAYGWEHWARVSMLDNPVGYLFRVGQSRIRQRKRPRLFMEQPARIPEVEPQLASALMSLPASQRTAVWLAHGCGWSHAEVAAVLDVTTSTVSTHVARALARLRSELGVETDA